MLSFPTRRSSDLLDQLRVRATSRLARVLRQVGGTPAARTDREALTVMYRQQLAQFDAAANGPWFGAAGVVRAPVRPPAARRDREPLPVMCRQQLAQFDAAENGLCFGRLEFNDGVRSYIGRLGMHADNRSEEHTSELQSL